MMSQSFITLKGFCWYTVYKLPLCIFRFQSQIIVPRRGDELVSSSTNFANQVSKSFKEEVVNRRTLLECSYRKKRRTNIIASETTLLPMQIFNISQLKQSFHQRGAYTLVFTHCSSFINHTYNFNATRDIDPLLRPSFAASLSGIFSLKNRAKKSKNQQ